MIRHAFLILSLSLIAVPGADAKMALVKNGKPEAVIVTAEAPSATAAEAAEVLQRYVEKISGARLEIRTEKNAGSGPKVYVGRSATVTRLGVEVPSYL